MGGKERETRMDGQLHHLSRSVQDVQVSWLIIDADLRLVGIL